MARCPHINVQQFTECCLDCGRNIYESDEEYYQHLRQRKDEQGRNALDRKIERLENELGIRHPGNRQNDVCEYGPDYGMY